LQLNSINRIQLTVGIIGLGVVGSAVSHSLESTSMIKIIKIDPDPKKNCHGTYEELENVDAVFICVPSPIGKDSRYDVTALEVSLEKLRNFRGVIISKVTATPDIYRRLGNLYPNLVHVPEFLTAANSIKDYANSRFMIIGGTVPAYQREAERIIRIGGHEGVSFNFCSLEEASMAKICINSFLATKVIFMNELYRLCQVNNIEFDNVTALMTKDDRIGKSHMKVPGPDGHFGFGGMCFPKDTEALLNYSYESQEFLNLLDTAIKKNTLLRLQK